MKKRIILSLIAAAVLIAAVVAVALLKNAKVTMADRDHTYDTMEDAVKNAPFNMQYSERLCGVPVTGFKSDGSMIEVQYGDAGYVRKVLGTKAAVEGRYSETEEGSVNGVTVTFKGDGGIIYLAVWTDNNCTYIIKVSDGVALEEMTEYIKETR